MKRKIRLTERDLHRIVKESVKRVIREANDHWAEAEDNYLMGERLPRGWEKIEREDDEPIYTDMDGNEFVKDEYGHFRPLDNWD